MSRVGDTVEVEVTAVVAGGDGLGRLGDGRVVFCDGGLPGERVVGEVFEHRRDYARARVTGVVRPSAGRVEAPCPHVSAGCGGCAWQHVRPALQEDLKVAIVADALRRIARLPDVVVARPPPGRPAVPSTGYRTTVRMGVGQDGRPAYRRRRSHRPVVVDACLVAHPRLEELITQGRFPGAREVVLRVSAATGERLAAPDRAEGRAVVPAGTAVGRDTAVHEQAAGRRWRVSAGSFFQSGPAAVDALVEGVAEAAGEPGPLVDLFAGVGVLGGALAERWDGVDLVAVEAGASASEDARANLRGLDARVVRSPVEAAGWEASVGFRPQVVIADPARAGLGAAGVAAVARLDPPVAVLVSCDPAALARDAALLAAAGYALEGVEVLDLFPHTPHVEAVSRFVRPG